MKMKKNVLALALCLTLAIMTLASCTTPQEGATTEPESATEPAKDSGEKTTIRFTSWMSGGEHVPFIEKFMDENPDINVEYEVLDGSNYEALMKVKIMSDDAPDVFMLQPAQVARYATDGYLMDVSAQPNMGVLDTNAGVKESVTFDGKQMGFPLGMSGGPIPVYYNVKYFESIGAKIPETMEEFYALCDLIKADGVEPLVFGNAEGWVYEFFFRYRQYSGMLMDHPDWTKELYEGMMTPSEFFVNEFTLAKDLVDKGYISPASATLNHPQSAGYMVDGKAAMLPQGTWEPTVEEIMDADPETFELGCFVSPVDPGSDGKIHAVGEIEETLVVSANTKQEEAAKRFYDFFTGPETLAEYMEARSLTTFLDIDYEVNPVLSGYVQEISSDKYSIQMKQKVQLPNGFMADALFMGFGNILSGSSAEDELARLDSEFDKVKDNSIVLE
jgi:raffinose/stachyose/melibiose transport system substrate-binding protein